MLASEVVQRLQHLINLFGDLTVYDCYELPISEINYDDGIYDDGSIDNYRKDPKNGFVIY